MRKVMLVEDEELILQGIRNIIDWEELGMRVVHMAHNGAEALDCFKKEPVDIIVTDINMPVMDGLEFLKELRKTERRACAILLTGYDEFDYARKAISLSVVDYILKPIDEDNLKKVILEAEKTLSEYDRRKNADIDDKIKWLQLLEGKLPEEEWTKYFSLLPEIGKDNIVYCALMKLDLQSLSKGKMTDVLVQMQREERSLKAIYLSADSLLLLYYSENKEETGIKEIFASFQNELESGYGILSFIGIGVPFSEYRFIQESYREAVKLQKYIVIEGYGSCVEASSINNRSSGDFMIDSDFLRKLVLKKDKEGALRYIEDLFINNIKEETSVDTLYRMCLKIALLLQEIKEEYKLSDKESMQNMTEMIERIFKAEDLFGIKAVFIGEIIEIITYLHEDNSQYTPVVKQIMTEVRNNYREDMNLKTLAYKYHMNASYLGQIFQKEVGCSFTQYLSNTKNSIAKHLILNTNMRINDIAKEVGYPDTSYFYRKFKQCYGVSPASLREMKNY